MKIAIIAILIAGFVFAGCSSWIIFERDTHTYIERRVEDERQRETGDGDGGSEAADEDNPGTGEGDGTKDS